MRIRDAGGGGGGCNREAVFKTLRSYIAQLNVFRTNFARLIINENNGRRAEWASKVDTVPSSRVGGCLDRESILRRLDRFDLSLVRSIEAPDQNA